MVTELLLELIKNSFWFYSKVYEARCDWSIYFVNMWIAMISDTADKKLHSDGVVAM